MFVAPKKSPVYSNRLTFAAGERPIIRNVDWGARSVPMARKGNIRGFYPNPFGDKPLEFESLLERDVITALFAHRPTYLASQPLTVHFELSGSTRRYTPDFLVGFDRVPPMLKAAGFERLTLIECKPPAKLEESAALLGRAIRAINELTSTPLLVVVSSSLTVASVEVRHDA